RGHHAADQVHHQRDCRRHCYPGNEATLLEIDREKEALENELLGFEQLNTVVELHPAAVDAYRRAVANLQSALASHDKERREAMDIIRSVLTSIHVLPQQARGQVELQVCGAGRTPELAKPLAGRVP